MKKELNHLMSKIGCPYALFYKTQNKWRVFYSHTDKEKEEIKEIVFRKLQEYMIEKIKRKQKEYPKPTLMWEFCNELISDLGGKNGDVQSKS